MNYVVACTEVHVHYIRNQLKSAQPQKDICTLRSKNNEDQVSLTNSAMPTMPTWLRPTILALIVHMSSVQSTEKGFGQDHEWGKRQDVRVSKIDYYRRYMYPTVMDRHEEPQ